MSKSYTLCQRVIAFDVNKNMRTIPEPEEDESYTVVKRLYTSIIQNDFKSFKEIYEKEYINNPTICDYFKFGDIGPWEDYSTYSLCDCINKNEEPEYINKYMSTRQCCCSGGKRYLAYLCTYNAGKNNFYDMKFKLQNSDIITPIKAYLLNDGPIDFNYRQTYQSYHPDYEKYKL